jgi:hypothetical protein
VDTLAALVLRVCVGNSNEDKEKDEKWYQLQEIIEKDLEEGGRGKK